MNLTSPILHPIFNPTQIWLSTTPTDMRCGSNKLLAHIIQHQHGIIPNTAYLFYNKTGTQLKILIHDGLGTWLCTRQLDNGKFAGLGEKLTRLHHNPKQITQGLTLNQAQFHALTSGLPWHNIGKELITPIL